MARFLNDREVGDYGSFVLLFCSRTRSKSSFLVHFFQNVTLPPILRYVDIGGSPGGSPGTTGKIVQYHEQFGAWQSINPSVSPS